MQQKNIFDLLKVDLDYSSLRNFLHEIVQVINQQSYTIQNLQKNQKLCVTTEQFIRSINTFSEQLVIQDPETNRLSQAVLNQQETTGDEFIDASATLNNRLQYILYNQNQIIKQERNNINKIQFIERQLQIKGDQEWVKEKLEVQEQKIRYRYEELDRVLQNHINELSQKLSSEIDQINVNIKNSEKQTVWKINECEKIICQKVNQDYVDQSLQHAEEKIKKNILSGQSKSVDSLHEQIFLLQEKNCKIDKSIEDLLRTIKQNQEQQKQQILETCMSVSNFGTFKALNDQKIKDLNEYIQGIEQRGDPSEYYRRSKESINHLSDQIFEFEKKQIQTKLLIQVIKTQTSPTEQIKQGLHSHDICQVEAEMKYMTSIFNELKEKQQENEKVTRQKLGTIEMNIMNTIANKKNEAQVSNIIKDEVLMIVDRLYGGYQDKMKELQRKQDEMMYQLREMGKHVDFKTF